MFGSSSPPQVQPVNPQATDQNAAKAAADAQELERKKLEKERGQAATVLGGDQLNTTTMAKPSLLSGISG